MSSLVEILDSFVGQPVGDPFVALDAVNVPMIRHWCDAIGDDLPVYTDESAAAASVHVGIVAPPTMLQAWTMRGFRPRIAAEANRLDELSSLLADHGYVSVVATDCRQDYVRYLRPGDVVEARSTIEAISSEKHTALGDGFFVTICTESRVDAQPVGTQRWSILMFRPKCPESEPNGPATESRPKRPRAALTHDNAWWFTALRSHRLLIQRCGSCGTLRHPPRPMCDKCRSFEWDTVDASGTGTIFSFVVNHHPQVPAFDYPLPIGLIELEEGTRLVAGLVANDPSEIRIGQKVVAEFVDFDADLSLPLFRIEA